MKIRITQAMIDKYDINDSRACPICQAMKEQLGFDHTVSVYPEHVFVNGRRIDVPREVEEWQHTGMNDIELIGPLEFELEHPYLTEILEENDAS